MNLTASAVAVPFSASLKPAEALKARRRLYPVTALYSAYACTVTFLALRNGPWTTVLAFFGAGVAAWTLVEYLVHRYVLHGRFPDGPGFVQHLLHRSFDHLHIEHHKRPWDGNHVSGTTKDTLPFVLVLAGASYLTPLPTLPVFVAAVLLSYIAEEWVHHSVHFCSFKGRYFQYIRRHHLFHHSPIGSEVGYGLTSGLWDVLCRTRIPAPMRRALYTHTQA